MDADTLKIGDAKEQREGLPELRGVGEHYRIDARGNGGAAIDFLLGTHGEHVQLTVGGFQGVAEQHAVNAEAAHRVSTASLGSL